MEQWLQSWPFRAALAVCLVGVALLSSLIVNTLFQINAPYFFFLAAVVASAFVGGSLTGLLATMLSVVVASYFVAEPRYSFTVASRVDQLRIAFFLVEGTLLSLLTGLLKSTHPLLLRKPWQRYGVIVPLLLMAFALKGQLAEAFPTANVPYRFCYLTVLIAARCGGLGPALLATLVSGLIGMFLPGALSMPHLVQPEDAVRLLAFLLESILISFVGSSLFLAREQAERHSQEVRRQQGQLAESERRYRLLLEGVRDYAIFLLDPQGRITSWNSSAERIFGLPGRAILGQHVATLARPDEAEARLNLEQIGTRGDPEHWEWAGWLSCQDGKRIWTELVITGLRNDQEARAFSVVLRDLTERHRATEVLTRTQEQLRQAQKLESIGRLAGGVAHDFNNLIMILSGYSDVLLKQLPPADPLRDIAQQIQLTVERATGLTGQLLAFSRGQVLKPVLINLNILIHDMGKLLRSLTGEGVRVSLALAPDLWSVRVDRVQLEQVLMNLVVNAHEAMPAGGELTLSTSNATSGLARAEPAEAPVGDWVVLMVTDTGCGMDEAVKTRVFEPFFTTKKQGHGLGLATVHGIVTQSGGHIALTSAVGRGTTIRVYLPCYQETKPLPSPTPDPVPTATTRGPAILVVDDEASVRTLLRLLLQKEGYDVLEASQGREALAQVQQRQGAVDLLLTDVALPELNGIELAQQLRRTHPHLPVLFLSAHPVEVLNHLGLSEQEIVLAKPFNLDRVLMEIRKLLDQAVVIQG
jgi:PAS domain S-box-containing protein